MEQKKLTRSTNKILAGVCGGVAEYFDVDPTLVRVIYATLSIFTTGFPGLLLYLILMLLIPAAPLDASASSNAQQARRPEPEDVEYTNVKREE